jgi:4-aminobutyrate aminotransferase
MQGEGGYVLPPPGYFETLRKICDKHGILLMVDEVQTGFGRTGKMWAIEHWGVVPDILCVAKGIASGLPLGAMISRADLHTWPPGAHANTFGGNPIACATALKTIQMIEDELLENARTAGAYLSERLSDLTARYAILGDRRGLGLMQGIEVVRSKATREKAPALRDQIVQRCFQRGFLIMGAGENSIRFLPPLNVTPKEIDQGMSLFEDVVARLARDGSARED